MSGDVADDDPFWTEACRREEVIRGLLDRCPHRLTIDAVEDVASALGLSRATTYRLIKRYRAARTVDALLDQPFGRPKGSLQQRPERDAVINEYLEREYLQPTRPPLRPVVAHIAIACQHLGLPAPTWRTVKARLLLLDERIRASHRGETATIRATKATPGEYAVARPLQVVQIDHTQVDVIVVEEDSRESAGRPWITLAIDLMTRMVTGFHLGLDAPSRTSIGLCLLHAVYDKTAWLAERNIDAPWPVAGLPEALHADNGTDIRSRTFERACRNHGVQIKGRPYVRPIMGDISNA